MNSDLHNKYRPQTFDEVVGHAEVVRSLKAVLDKDKSHAFLFTGPAGLGKTTMARLIANYLKCGRHSLLEIDAATFTGIDAMRNIVEGLQYAPIGDSPVKVVILDEAHALSKAAWQSLLKSIEEPPPHVYWCLCTTDLSRVPKTIQTRCLCYTLKPLKPEQILDLLEGVAKDEKLKVDGEVVGFLAESSEGSPRRALTLLSVCAEVKGVKEAASLLEKVRGEKEVIDLCRLIIKPGFTWIDAIKILKDLGTTDSESIRRVVVAYFTTVLLDSKGKDTPWLLTVLQAFSEPYKMPDQLAEVILSIGEIAFIGK